MAKSADKSARTVNAGEVAKGFEILSNGLVQEVKAIGAALRGVESRWEKALTHLDRLDIDWTLTIAPKGDDRETTVKVRNEDGQQIICTKLEVYNDCKRLAAYLLPPELCKAALAPSGSIDSELKTKASREQGSALSKLRKRMKPVEKDERKPNRKRTVAARVEEHINSALELVKDDSEPAYEHRKLVACLTEAQKIIRTAVPTTPDESESE